MPMDVMIQFKHLPLSLIRMILQTGFFAGASIRQSTVRLAL